MPEATPSRQSQSQSHGRTVKRWYRRRAFWLFAALAMVVLSVATAGYQVAQRVLTVKSELEAAQALAPKLQDQALRLDADGARSTLGEIRGHTGSAVGAAGGVLWDTA